MMVQGWGLLAQQTGGGLPRELGGLFAALVLIVVITSVQIWLRIRRRPPPRDDESEGEKPIEK